MPHNPTSIVRLLYGERTVEEKRMPLNLDDEPFSFFKESLTSALPIGQGHRSPRGRGSIDYFLFAGRPGVIARLPKVKNIVQRIQKPRWRSSRQRRDLAEVGSQ